MATPAAEPPPPPLPCAVAAMHRSSSSASHSSRDASAARPGSLTLESNDASDVSHASAAVAVAPASEVEKEERHTAFSRNEIRLIVLIASICGFISPLTNNAPLASLPDMSRDLGVSIEKATLSVTLAMIGQGISPLFFGSYTDILGRRPIYILCLIIYAGANAGLANLPHSYAGLLALRLVQAAGSASMISVGAGTIGDVTTPRTRGGYMGIFQAGAALGPCVGPIVGGLLTQAYGWRSVMWFCFIVGVLGLVLVLLFQPETLHRLVGDGSLPPPTLLHEAGVALLRGTTASQLKGTPRPGWPVDPNPPASSWRHFLRGLSRPLGPASLLLMPEVALLLFATALPFMGWTCITSTISSLFVEQYGLSTSEAGLIFLAPGVGTVLTGVCFGRLLDKDYRTAKRRVEREKLEKEKLEKSRDGEAQEEAQRQASGTEVPKEEVPLEAARLRRYPILLVMAVATLIAYGWTVERRVHLAVPCVLLFINAMAIGATMSVCQVLLVDWLPGRGASVTAANNLVRCLLGAGGTAAVQPVIARLGIGWTFMLVAAVCASAAPLAWLVFHRGQRWREARAAKLAERDAPAA